MNNRPNYCPTGWIHYYKVEDMFSNVEKFLESQRDDSQEMLTAETAWKEASQAAEKHFDTCAQCAEEQSRLLSPIMNRLVSLQDKIRMTRVN